MTFENHSHPPIRWHGYQITPIAQSFRFIPARPFGIIWNRPFSVQVETPAGEIYRLPVIDHTRFIQILIFLGGLALVWILKAINRKR
ncbi:MAG: hypothetical protein AB1522_05460 [Chloroflexota bacterium]